MDTYGLSGGVSKASTNQASEQICIGYRSSNSIAVRDSSGEFYRQDNMKFKIGTISNADNCTFDANFVSVETQVEAPISDISQIMRVASPKYGVSVD